MTSGGINCYYFPENQLTRFSVKLLTSDSSEHTKCSFTHRVGRGVGVHVPLNPPLLPVSKKPDPWYIFK